jgi:hypothetical protein
MTRISLEEGEGPVRRIFRVRSVIRTLGPLIVTAIITLGILLAVTPAVDWWIVGVVGVALLGSVGVAAWLVGRTRLEVSPAGITYHAIGYRVSGTWGDVTGHATRTMGASSVDSLILRTSGLELSGWMAFAYRLLPFAQVVSVLDGRYIPAPAATYEDAIPVGLFDRDWRTGEIGSVVRAYAPKAFDTPVD